MMEIRMNEAIETTRIAATLAVVALCASVAGAAVPSGEGWSRLETENFALFSNLDRAEAERIGLDLERLRAALGELFPRASFDAPLPTFLYVFGDRVSFAPYALGDDEPGYLAPHAHANFAAVVASDAGEALPIVYRQYIHELIDDNVPQLPFWLRLGLAELFSSFEADERIGRVGLPLAVGLDLAEGSALALPELLAADGPPADGEALKRLASRAWGLVHYLIVEESERLEAARRFVGELRDDPAAEVSILDALGVTISDLERGLGEYLARDPLARRDVALPAKTPDRATFTTLERHEALFHLGDLLIHVQPQRRDLAAEHFAAALTLAPGHPAAVAGTGYGAELAGDLEAARERYRAALTELPDAFRLQYYYGDCELRILGQRRPASAEEEQALERAIAALLRVTELRPTYGEAWARLGYAYNLQARPAGEAVPILERAYEMLPDRSDVAHNLLLGYARAGNREEATGLVETMAARDADAATLAASRQVLHQLDFQYAGALARERRFDDAVAIFARVQAGADDPGLRQRAAESLSKVEAGATGNRFAPRLLEARAALDAGDAAKARDLLRALAGDAAGSLQQEVVADLLSAISGG
jgi:tetratricopeptide (TPR) repeat protein